MGQIGCSETSLTANLRRLVAHSNDAANYITVGTFILLRNGCPTILFFMAENWAIKSNNMIAIEPDEFLSAFVLLPCNYYRPYIKFKPGPG